VFPAGSLHLPPPKWDCAVKGHGENMYMYDTRLRLEITIVADFRYAHNEKTFDKEDCDLSWTWAIERIIRG